MSEDPNRKPFSGFRNPLLYTSTLLLVALIYVAGTFCVRRQQNREIEQRAADAAAAKERTNDALTVEQLGGSEFKILNFYATPPVVRAGEAVQLCYGVSNAKTVKLEPQAMHKRCRTRPKRRTRPRPIKVAAYRARTSPCENRRPATSSSPY